MSHKHSHPTGVYEGHQTKNDRGSKNNTKISCRRYSMSHALLLLLLSSILSALQTSCPHCGCSLCKDRTVCKQTDKSLSLHNVGLRGWRVIPGCLAKVFLSLELFHILPGYSHKFQDIIIGILCHRLTQVSAKLWNGRNEIHEYVQMSFNLSHPFCILSNFPIAPFLCTSAVYSSLIVANFTQDLWRLSFNNFFPLFQEKHCCRVWK